jgi:glycosyltransferase involved in cell wall biosynthesis
MTSIVIVEDRAQMPLGHFPGEFAELADGFVGLGLDVDVLTRRGWALEGSRSRAWNLHEAGPIADRLLGIARRGMDTSGYFAGRSDQTIGVRARLGAILRTVVLIISARRLASSSSSSSSEERTPIVVVAMDFMPALLSIFGGSNRWLIWQFSPDVQLGWLARFIETTRRILRRPARAVSLAAHDDSWIDTVSAQIPQYLVVGIPLIASRSVHVDRDSARAALGLDPLAKVAVLFGAGHPDQAPEVVLEAFRQRPDWQLVIGGQVCSRVDSPQLSEWGTPPLMSGGFVDESVRERLFSSADLAVLSFVRSYRLRSGTVIDAASCCLPILVSAGSQAANLVLESGAGEVFEAESPESLLKALDRMDLVRAREGSERLRESCSSAVVCSAHLEVLGTAR